MLDGKTIPNPLRSFIFNKNIKDFISGDNPDYSKLKGYETVRYPLSGLVGNEEERNATKQHNEKYPNYDQNVKLLDQNLVDWLTSHIVVDGTTIQTNVKDKYMACLEAPNYTVFSNTTSAAQWNADLDSGAVPIVPLESPHNSIHVAVGGFDVPGYDRSPIDGANGDMGENDTAGLDPIFFFHHCFVDRVFWLWQKRHRFTDHLDVIPEYPGTNSVDSQGPTPGIAPNSWLTLESPLNPFKKKGEQPGESLYLARLHQYRKAARVYLQCRFAGRPTLRAALQQDHSSKVICVSGINRAPIRGSFLISAFANMSGKRYHVGNEAVLSRWNVQYCANCQTHLEVKAFFGLHGFRKESVDNATYEIEIRKRTQLNRSSALATAQQRPFRVEVR